MIKKYFFVLFGSFISLIALGCIEEVFTDNKPLRIHAEGEPSKTYTEPVTGIAFVKIQGGCFSMGQREADRRQIINIEGGQAVQIFSDELPRHEVCVDSFWLGQHEVTNSQYRKYEPTHASKQFQGFSLNEASQPVVNVSWKDAKSIAVWLTKQHQPNVRFRLPTEAEWEYACRSGSPKIRPWGNQVKDACKYANVADASFKRNIKVKSMLFMKQSEIDDAYRCDDTYVVASPVGSFRPNGFGVYDMLGNVWEWCEDSYSSDAYRQHARKNPIHKDDEYFKVRRGGSWSDNPNYLRSAVRAKTGAEDDTSVFTGFRLVMIVEN